MGHPIGADIKNKAAMVHEIEYLIPAAYEEQKIMQLEFLFSEILQRAEVWLVGQDGNNLFREMAERIISSNQLIPNLPWCSVGTLYVLCVLIIVLLIVWTHTENTCYYLRFFERHQCCTMVRLHFVDHCLFVLKQATPRLFYLNHSQIITQAPWAVSL